MTTLNRLKPGDIVCINILEAPAKPNWVGVLLVSYWPGRWEIFFPIKGKTFGTGEENITLIQ